MLKIPTAKAAAIFVFSLFVSVLSSIPAKALELVMVEQQGCSYCEMWDEQIADIYPKTAEGRFAPLRRMDITETDSADVTFARTVNFTPTFVLVEAGQELGRIEGYPGEDFFWWMLTRLLMDNTTFEGAGG